MPSFHSLLIYFMSGTGNSYRAASWLAQEAHSRGVRTTLVPYNQADPHTEIKLGEQQVVGLVFPTHGFTTPWGMLKLAWRIPRRRGTPFFVMATRGAARPFGLLMPGMMGTAAHLLASILILKGYHLVGLQGLDMPSNWTAMYPALSEANVAPIERRARVKTIRFMQALLRVEPRLGGWLELALGLLLLPVSLAYLLMGRLVLGKLFFASYKCDNCGVCLANCPNQAIKLWGGRPYWTYRCESCMRCMAYCPKQAVEAGWSLGVGFYFLATYPAAWLLLDWLARQMPALAVLNHGALALLLQYGYSLLAVFLAYGLFSLLVRIPAVNKAFTVTTPTRYYRRHRAPEVRLAQLGGRQGKKV
jgi:NAD-dependent dihydropyrimidine dehydrogenase PreA subunit